MAKTKEPPKPKTSAKKPEKTAKKPPVKKTPQKGKKTDVPLPNEYFCSFCGRSNKELMALIAGPKNIFICDECIEVCLAILLDDDRDNHNLIWRQRVIDRLANPSKIPTVSKDEAKKVSNKNGKKSKAKKGRNV